MPPQFRVKPREVSRAVCVHIIYAYTDEAVIEGEEGLKALEPPSTSCMVHFTSLYKVAADNLG